MKSFTKAVLLVCTVLLICSNGFAAEERGNGSAHQDNDGIVAQRSPEQLRIWLNDIKPAAGHRYSSDAKNNYWEQTVNRRNRRRMSK